MSTIWRPTSGGAYVESGLLPRVELWKRGVGFFLAAPLTGVGVGAFEVAEGRSHGGSGAWMTAHNSFVQLGAELGVFGFTLFLALIVLGIRDARRVVRAAKRDARLRPLTWVARAVEMSLYAYVVEGFALSQAYSPMLYFLIAVAVALRLQVERTAPAPVPARVVAAPVVLRPRTATK
jgi:O-antigen ligase